jgi:hypothetical protein
MHHKLLAVAREKLLPGGFFIWATFMQASLHYTVYSTLFMNMHTAD